MSNSSTRGSLQPPLSPRDGDTIWVLGIARISGPNQDVLSLADQEALYRRWLDEHIGPGYHLVMIAGRGSGEILDREESRRARASVESSRFDLVIAEDLGRIFRRVHAQLFCELCEDYGTRLIALNDQVDTAHDNWRVLAGFANMRHEMYNADTAKRIRRTQRNRFEGGGLVQTVVFGYVKPEGTKTDAQLQKDPAAEPIYEEIFRLLEGGAGYSEVADMLNARGVKPGPYVRTPQWNCSVVSRLIHNPILKGVRVRGKKESKRVNETGRRKSVDAAPGARLERHCPHLAFIDALRYDRLIAELDERNARFRRKGVNGIDSRKNVPKKKTVWPGQHIDCGVCGRPFFYGGHGQKDHLMCRGAHDYRCWNSITVDGPSASAKLMVAIHAAIAGLPDFDPVLMQLLGAEVLEQQGDSGRKQSDLAKRLATAEREIKNLMAVFKAGATGDSLIEELACLEKEKVRIAWEQQQLARASKAPTEVPTVAEVKGMAEKAFGDLAVTSQEFGRILRGLIPRIVVFPYRLCDGGHPVLRARFTLSLASLLPSVPGLDRLASALRCPLEVDLFDPPQREGYRLRVLESTACGLKQRDIAGALGITQPAVQDAMALARCMEELGIDDPYMPLAEPPDDYNRLRMHLHPRYRFEPLNAPSEPI
jgi:site-specific DNA recombinase